MALVDGAWQNQCQRDVYQNHENIVWCFSLHIYPVHLDNFVADVNQTGSISGTAMHDARNYYFPSFFIRLDCRALRMNRVWMNQIQFIANRTETTRIQMRNIEKFRSKPNAEMSWFYASEFSDTHRHNATYYNRFRTLCSNLFCVLIWLDSIDLSFFVFVFLICG